MSVDIVTSKNITPDEEKYNKSIIVESQLPPPKGGGLSRDEFSYRGWN